jgi:tRNA (adenine57-N1/adenine58-N1)-methyltransferase
VVSYEVRPEFHETAARNIEAFLGKVPAWVDLRLGDLSEVAGTGETFDRVVLDIPEPWGALDLIERAMSGGAIVCGYLPTTGQVQAFVLALGERGFIQVETFEVLVRSWHVTERSVRPDHRMVGHTGFVTVGRLGPARPGDQEPGRRA